MGALDETLDEDQNQEADVDQRDDVADCKREAVVVARHREEAEKLVG